AAADLVVQVLHAPAHLPASRDLVDAGLEARVRHPVAFAWLEGEPTLARGAAAPRALFVLAVGAAANADHRGPPSGCRPRPSTNTRSQASSIASVHSRSPMRRRRVSWGAACP